MVARPTSGIEEATMNIEYSMHAFWQWVLGRSDLFLSVLAILVSALLVWWLVARQANRARRRFDALLSLAHASGDAEHEIAGARRRLTTLRLVVNACRYVLGIGALLMILRRLGVPLDSLLLPAGFIGAGLGLGAQNLVRDVVAGLFIVFEGQLAVGDVVSVDGKSGTVQEVGLRVTHLLSETGHDLYFANGTINVVDKHPRRAATMIVRIPISDAAKTEAARPLLLSALHQFDRDYRAFALPPEAGDSPVVHPVLDVSSQQPHDADIASGAIYFRLEILPNRVALVQSKLGARLTGVLESHGIPKSASAEVEIFDAPALLSSANSSDARLENTKPIKVIS